VPLALSYDGCSNFQVFASYILVALDKISTWQSSEARKAALSLKNSKTRLSFFVGSLVILENISGVMLPTTRSLQKVGTDFVQAKNDIGDMISTLQSLRTEVAFGKLFQEASHVAETFLNCTIKKPRTVSRAVYRTAAANTAKDTAEDYYRINVFYPAVDTILRDLELRFGPKQKIAMNLSHLIAATMPAAFNEEETEAA